MPSFTIEIPTDATAEVADALRRHYDDLPATVDAALEEGLGRALRDTIGDLLHTRDIQRAQEAARATREKSRDSVRDIAVSRGPR